METITRELPDAWPREGISIRQKRSLYVAMWLANAVLLLGNLALALGCVPPVETLGMQLNEGTGQIGGAWYPSMLLLLLGLASIWHYSRSRGRPGFAPRPASIGWLLLGLLAVASSADGVICLGEAVRHSSLARDRFLSLTADWTAVFSPVTLGCMAFLALFSLRSFGGRYYAARLAVAAFACWAGSVVLGIATCGLATASVTQAAWWYLVQPLTEAFELSGVTLYLMALIELSFDPVAPPLAAAANA